MRLTKFETEKKDSIETRGPLSNCWVDMINKRPTVPNLISNLIPLPEIQRKIMTTVIVDQKEREKRS